MISGAIPKTDYREKGAPSSKRSETLVTGTLRRIYRLAGPERRLLSNPGRSCREGRTRCLLVQMNKYTNRYCPYRSELDAGAAHRLSHQLFAGFR